MENQEFISRFFRDHEYSRFVNRDAFVIRSYRYLVEQLLYAVYKNDNVDVCFHEGTDECVVDFCHDGVGCGDVERESADILLKLQEKFRSNAKLANEV